MAAKIDVQKSNDRYLAEATQMLASMIRDVSGKGTAFGEAGVVLCFNAGRIETLRTVGQRTVKLPPPQA